MTSRTILITGCSSGIGLESARVMKARGWRVLATARRDQDLAMLERDVGVEALYLEQADPESVAACAGSALSRTGGAIDAFFNNAAYGQVGAVEDLTADTLRRQFEVNVIAGHEIGRLLLPAMRRRGAGRIVHCSSVLGLVAAPYRGAYCASKFAMEALADAMRLELRGTDIQVVLIEPGPIRTRFLEAALANFRASIDVEGSAHRDIYKARLASMEAGGRSTFKREPAAVAAKLVHAVESPRPRRRYYVTTPTYIAAGLKRLLPPPLLDRFLLKV